MPQRFAKSFLLVAAFLWTACKEKTYPDITPPVLKINSPENHAIYDNGDSLKIDIDVSDNVKLSSVDYQIYETTYPEDQLKQSEHYKVNAIRRLISFSQLLQVDIIDSVTGDTLSPKERTYQLVVKAVDASDNATTKKAEYHVLF